MHVAVVAAMATFRGAPFGYETGIVSGTILFLHSAFHLSSLMLGMVTSLAMAGAAAGALVC
jgi:hypothetical protein